MSVAGLCQVCEEAEVEHDCDRCGALVCERHWDPQTSFCVKCAAEVGPADHGTDDRSGPDGVDEYQF